MSHSLTCVERWTQGKSCGFQRNLELELNLFCRNRAELSDSCSLYFISSFLDAIVNFPFSEVSCIELQVGFKGGGEKREWRRTSLCHGLPFVTFLPASFFLFSDLSWVCSWKSWWSSPVAQQPVALWQVMHLCKAQLCPWHPGPVAPCRRALAHWCPPMPASPRAQLSNVAMIAAKSWPPRAN